MEVTEGKVYRYREPGEKGLEKIVQIVKIEGNNVWMYNSLLKIKATCTVEDFKTRAKELEGWS